MSDKPEIELDLDLQLLPAWARQPQGPNRYADFEDAGDRERRGPRGRGTPGPGGPRREGRGDRRPDPSRPRSDGGPGRSSFRGQEGRGRPRRDEGRRFDGPRREPPVEDLPEGITVDLIPEPTGVDSLTRQIRQTGRAYPLFDIGHLILKRPDRYQLEFKATGNLPDGSPRQLYLCSLDDSIWMSEGDAVRHVLARHFDMFYQTEKIAVDPPKGTYTFVAQCGMSGIILGPPNLHDYPAKLQRLHAERFSRVPFDVFKSRVRIVRDEATVKKWIDEQSFKSEFACLNVPEPQKLSSMEGVEQHFRQVHLPNIIRPVTSHMVRSTEARDMLPPPLRRLARREFDLQQRFPLKLVTRLSEDFAHRGLHFFKVNKTVLHVAVARPRYLDLETNPVTDGVKRILQTIEKIPHCTRRKLLEALGVQLPGGAEAAAGAGSAPPATEGAPSPELQAIVTDLHWLIHEGHVIEFANGHLEAAKKPAPRPIPPPRPQPPRAPAAPVAESSGKTDETAGEKTSSEAAEVTGTSAGESSAVTEAASTAPQRSNESPAGESTPPTSQGAPAATSEPLPEEARLNPS